MASLLKAQKKELRVFIIYILIIALGWIMPEMGGVTKVGFRVLAIFVAVVFGWASTNNMWVSLIVIPIIPLTGVTTLANFISGGWGLEVCLLTVMIFVLIGFFEQVGITKFLAAWLLSRKIVKGRPWALIAMLFVASYLICGMIHIFVGIFLLWSLVYNISYLCGYKPFDKVPTILLIGVAITAGASQAAFPWSSSALVLLTFFNGLGASTLDITQYVTFSIPFGLVGMLFYILACRFLFRMDVSALRDLDITAVVKAEDLQMTTEKRIGLYVLFSVVLLFLIPGFLPKEWAVTTFFTTIGYVGRLAIVFLVLAWMKIDDKPLFDFPDLAKKNIMWPMIGILLVVIPLGGLLTNEATGISVFLNDYILPLFNGMSYLTFLIIASIVIIILTNVLANLVVAMMFMPLGVMVATAMGGDANVIACVMINAAMIAWMTPSAAGPGTLMCSNKEWLKYSDIAKYGGGALLTSGLALIVVCFCWMSIF